MTIDHVFEEEETKTPYNVDLGVLRSVEYDESDIVFKTIRILLASRLTDRGPTGLGHVLLIPQMFATYQTGKQELALREMAEFVKIHRSAKYWEDFIDFSYSINFDTTEEEDGKGMFIVEQLLAVLMVREACAPGMAGKFSIDLSKYSVYFDHPEMGEQSMVLGPSCRIRSLMGLPVPEAA